MSNPIGETCLSPVDAARFDSIKKRPAKRKRKSINWNLNAGELSETAERHASWYKAADAQ